MISGPVTAGARARYEAWHSQREVDREARSPWHRLVGRNLDWARDVAGRRLLEMACGRGELAIWLAGHANPPALMVAGDFAWRAVHMAREAALDRHGLRPGWVLGDAQALAHPDETFDTVISCETIEHVPSPAAALGEFHRVLRPGGRLYLTTPNYMSTIGLYRAYLAARGRRFDEGGQPISHLVMVPRTRRWLGRAGFRVVRIDGGGHYLPVPGRPPVEIALCERLGPLSRWFGLHSCFVAEKPSVPETSGR